MLDERISHLFPRKAVQCLILEQLIDRSKHHIISTAPSACQDHDADHTTPKIPLLPSNVISSCSPSHCLASHALGPLRLTVHNCLSIQGVARFAVSGNSKFRLRSC